MKRELTSISFTHLKCGLSLINAFILLYCYNGRCSKANAQEIRHNCFSGAKGCTQTRLKQPYYSIIACKGRIFRTRNYNLFFFTFLSRTLFFPRREGGITALRHNPVVLRALRHSRSSAYLLCDLCTPLGFFWANR